jgi:hypothetical protein
MIRMMPALCCSWSIVSNKVSVYLSLLCVPRQALSEVSLVSRTGVGRGSSLVSGALCGASCIRRRRPTGS